MLCDSDHCLDRLGRGNEEGMDNGSRICAGGCNLQVVVGSMLGLCWVVECAKHYRSADCFVI